MGNESKHFKAHELSCKGVDCCGGRNGATTELLNACEVARHCAADVPTVVTSAYRCPKHNNNVGSKHTSFHVRGLAIDVFSMGNHRANTVDGKQYIEAILRRAGFWTYQGPNFVHGDLRNRMAGR